MITPQKRTVFQMAFLFVFVFSLFITPAIHTLGAPAGQADTCERVTLHYHRRNNDYSGWGLHIWGPTVQSITWESPLQPAGEDEFGLFWVVLMNPGADLLNYIVHLGNEKDPGPDQ